jgi:hypothetical protein
MGQLHDMTVAYFQATKNYFWQWEEEGEVIEWKTGGATICYKTELLNDLSQIKRHLPPLGPLLLVISLSKLTPGPQAIQATMHEYVQIMGDIDENLLLSQIEVEEIKTVITNFIALLRPLPGRYWKGIERDFLQNTLFESVEIFPEGETAKEMLAIFQRGAFNYVIAHSFYGDPLQRLKDDINVLKQILQRFPDTATLENKLNAVVIPSPPAPAPIEIPAGLPKPEQMDDLLEALADDNDTVLLSLLTQRLIAALHLPMHTKGYSETSFGGVSDITNKGNFDRLLLSELANEDETLMVRLANNEALYLRREELPDNEPGQRFILIDKSIKTWGTPHLLAMAAALACAIDNKQHAEILPFALLGDQYKPINLSSRNEVIVSMQCLSPKLHSGEALSAFAGGHSMNKYQEYFLITSDELFHAPAFQHSFAALRRADGFVITVNRDCRIQLYRYASGHRKLLRTAKISMEMPEVASKRPTVKHIASDVDLPQFLKLRPFPLYIPQQLSSLNNGFFAEGVGALAVTKYGQLLFWEGQQRGAMEITADFPDAHGYYFGFDDEYFFILFQAKGAEQLSLYHLKRYTLELSPKEIKKHELVKSISRNAIREMSFKDGVFYICVSSAPSTIAIDARNGGMSLSPDITREKLKTMGGPARNMGTYLHSYNTINRLKHLEINDDIGDIVINNHRIVFKAETVVLMKINSIKQDHHLEGTEKQVGLPDSRQSISKYTWPDGSEAWFDNYRHMLHLRSSNKLLPEITIVLIVNQATVCWASDNTICGVTLFGTGNEKIMQPQTFREKYIQPFIQVIQQHGTAAVI